SALLTELPMQDGHLPLPTSRDCPHEHAARLGSRELAEGAVRVAERVDGRLMHGAIEGPQQRFPLVLVGHPGLLVGTTERWLELVRRDLTSLERVQQRPLRARGELLAQLLVVTPVPQLSLGRRESPEGVTQLRQGDPLASPAQLHVELEALGVR